MLSLWQCVGQCLEFWCVDASFSLVEVSCVSCEKVWCTSPWMCVCVFASAGGGASQWDVLKCAVLG